MRKEMSQMTQEIKWMKDQCGGLEVRAGGKCVGGD
jgi:hypothetical protein